MRLPFAADVFFGVLRLYNTSVPPAQVPLHRAAVGAIVSVALRRATRAGHPYPELPTFGLPCPTTIFSIGALASGCLSGLCPIRRQNPPQREPDGQALGRDGGPRRALRRDVGGAPPAWRQPREIRIVKPVMNPDDVEFDDVEDNGIYTSRRGQISDRIGARKLGYNLTVLPPGKVQCPFHSHHGEEEMFLILEGEGELRFGDQRYPLRRLDVIACPPGGPEVAHQIINT